MERPLQLTQFLDAVRDVSLAGALDGDARKAAERIFTALEQPATELASDDPEQVDACRHLPAALDHAREGSQTIAALADAFAALSPLLTWQRRVDAIAHGPTFYDGHANTRIVGPNALERRSDVIIGASLVAPEISYPEHHHPPEEFYIVMSEGEWYQQGRGWHSPGIGGIVYNPSGIGHAMRSAQTPLFAVWCLWAGTS